MKKYYASVVSNEFSRQESLGHFKTLTNKALLRFKLKAIAETLDATALTFALSKLAVILNTTTKRRVLVLIDEYDEPIVSAAENGYLVKVYYLRTAWR